MRTRHDTLAAPEFINEKQARKQAERQAMRDAMSGDVSGGEIEWSSGLTIPPAVSRAVSPADSRAIPPAMLASPRIQLRQWQDADRDLFAAMTSDYEVMQHFPSLLTREQSEAWVDRAVSKIAARGWGFWAMDYLAQGASCPQFAGFTGLNIPDPELPVGPCVEVGWRLAPAFWGLGLAGEAARLSLRVGFEALGLDEIVAVTTLRNGRSRKVMQRLDMQESPADEFDHPAYPPGNPERRCCLYRLPRECWLHADSLPPQSTHNA
ncbi:hypothetical protein BH11PSE7_BH11PSE7_02600 [soil metagenome]